MPLKNLFGRWFGPRHAKQRIYFSMLTMNHLAIFEDAARILLAENFNVSFLLHDDHNFFPELMSALAEKNLPGTVYDPNATKLEPGDVIILGNDWVPTKLRNNFDALKASHIRLIGVIEGGRFARPVRYRSVQEVLVWGPSAMQLYPCPATMIGSPVLEKRAELLRTREATDLGVINYKFTFAERDQDPELNWLASAIDACEAAAVKFTISSHPANAPLPERYPVSMVPIEELLARATFLISRSSNVVYEALIMAVPVIFFPFENEEICEFGEPMGAYHIARDGRDLARLAQDIITNQKAGNPPQSERFLCQHLSRDPAESAAARMARAIKRSSSDAKAH